MATPSAASASEQDNFKTKVAFLGPFNSYTHQATKIAFPDSKWHLEPTATIKVFDRVQSRQAPYGVVPFENSTHGVVTFTLDNLADRGGEYADIAVCDEVYLDVHHFLLGRCAPPGAAASSSSPTAAPPPPPVESTASAPASTTTTTTAANHATSDNNNGKKGIPLTSLAHIRRVYSHPQAFGQTGLFVRRHLPRAETIEVSSTSRAAELAAADGEGASAAIASEMAGRGLGLDVLARWVEDREDNTTRFFVVRRSGGGEGGGGGLVPLPERGGGGGGGGGEEGGGGGGGVYDGGKYKSLVSFTVPHRRPGALADVLDCFKGRGLNLTSINSLPSLVGPFQYLFFVEFEGSRFDDPEGRVGGVLEDLGRVAERWRWLGSWLNRRGAK